MEISSFPGSFGDNSTPKGMTYTHIVGKQTFFGNFLIFFEHEIFGGMYFQSDEERVHF